MRRLLVQEHRQLLLFFPLAHLLLLLVVPVLLFSAISLAGVPIVLRHLKIFSIILADERLRCVLFLGVHRHFFRVGDLLALIANQDIRFMMLLFELLQLPLPLVIVLERVALQRRLGSKIMYRCYLLLAPLLVVAIIDLVQFEVEISTQLMRLLHILELA